MRLRAYLLVLSIGLAACSSTPAATICMSSRECSAAGLVCDLAAQRCVDCVGNADCLAADQICQANLCVARVACTSSRACPGQVCDVADGYCVDCNADVDCTGGLHCVSHGCVMPAPTCHSDRECSAMGFVCDVAHTRCVECVAAADCPAMTHCSAEHTCVTGTPPDGGPLPDAGSPDAGVAPDAGGPVDSGGPPDSGGAPDAGTVRPTHGAIHLTWTISDTFGPLTCADVGMATVEMLNPVDRSFPCGAGAGDVTGIPFGFGYVSAQGNDSSHTFLASSSGGGSLDFEASPCDSIIAGDCAHNVQVDFHF